MSMKTRTKYLIVWSVVDRTIATIILSALFTTQMLAAEGTLPSKIGTDGPVGCQSSPKRVKQLVFTKPGVYENYLVDGDWATGTLVKITADDVVLRHCEIRHGQHNAVTVYAKNVTIESCRIQYVLAGSIDQQEDAHGVTG